MNVSLPGAVTKVTTMRDRTVRVQIDLQECPPETMADLFALNDTYGWFFFADQQIKEIDKNKLPDINVEKWEKHPSQTMRAIWYRVWELTDRSKSFEVFYREKMDMVNEWIKEKYLN